jgi:peptidoglycan/xylan/chitin deacetylase (PgdA/CDA1 family)
MKLRWSIGMVVALVASLMLVMGPAQAATYSNSRCGNTSGRVLLTFDDWAYGDPFRATRIGEYLESRGIRAGFFLINQYAKSYPEIIATLRQQGHWVANHSYSHPDLTKLAAPQISWEIRRGVFSNRLRPPYGAYNSTVANVATNLGYRICTWTIDTRDWEKPDGTNYRSSSSIRSIVRNSPASAKSNGVVLGHLYTNFPTSTTIGGIISDLRAQGYSFCRNSGPVGHNMPFPLAC